MERSEPVFVPEWSRTPTGSFNTISASNNKSSSNTDDHRNRTSSRHRISLSGSDNDIAHSYSFIGRNSSFSCRRSVSNGSTSRDRDNSSMQSRAYSSFSRSHRDRAQEKDFEYNERESLHLVDNGYCEYPDSCAANRTEKDMSRQSQSTISGRRPELWPKKPGNDGVLSVRSSVNSISKTSFERDFPSLGTKEKQCLPSIQRISSPGPVTAVQILPLGSSAIIGGNGWTSALVDVPVTTSATPAGLPVTASGTNTGLNMAETLAQAPARARTPQLSVETQKLEELAIKQSRQLIPVTPSTPKALALSSSEKLKPKGARAGDTMALSKVVQQSSFQSVNYSLRGPARSDASKPSQIGNFQILNRDRNGNSPSIKEVSGSTNVGKVLNLVGAAPSAIASKLNIDSKPIVASLTKSSSMEKKSSSQAQNRHDFFNTIRNSKSSNHSTTSQEQYSVMSCSKSEMTAHSTVQAKNTGSSASSTDCSMESNNNLCGNCNGFKELEGSTHEELEQDISCPDGIVDPDEEEARFLRSLGWEENAGGNVRLWDVRSCTAVWEMKEQNDCFADVAISDALSAIFKVGVNSGDVFMMDLRKLASGNVENQWVCLGEPWRRTAGDAKSKEGSGCRIESYGNQVFCSKGSDVEMWSEVVIGPSGGLGMEDGFVQGRVMRRNVMGRVKDGAGSKITQIGFGGSRMVLSRKDQHCVEVWESPLRR